MGILFVELHDQEAQGFDTPTGLVTGNAALYDFRAHLSKVDRTNRGAFGQSEAHSFMSHARAEGKPAPPKRRGRNAPQPSVSRLASRRRSSMSSLDMLPLTFGEHRPEFLFEFAASLDYQAVSFGAAHKDVARLHPHRLADGCGDYYSSLASKLEAVHSLITWHIMTLCHFAQEGHPRPDLQARDTARLAAYEGSVGHCPRQ